MGRQRPPKGIIDGLVDAIFGSNPSREKSVSSKNKNRTGGQSNGGPGKNAIHGTGGHHSQIAKGQRGSQGPRK